MLGLIIRVRFLISYLHPGKQEIVQVMDDYDSGEESREEGRGGAGAGDVGRSQSPRCSVSVNCDTMYCTVLYCTVLYCTVTVTEILLLLNCELRYFCYITVNSDTTVM